MSEQYSNRELDSHFQEIKDQLDRIEGQTTRTNGRVNKLENWQSLIIGGASIVSFIVIPTLVWVFTNTVEQVRGDILVHEKLDNQRFDK